MYSAHLEAQLAKLTSPKKPPKKTEAQLFECPSKTRSRSSAKKKTAKPRTDSGASKKNGGTARKNEKSKKGN